LISKIGSTLILGLFIAGASATLIPTEPTVAATPGLLCGEVATEVSPSASLVSSAPGTGGTDPARRIRFERISTEPLAVTGILQDRKGFLWLATSEGLNKYDGYSFKVYKHDPDDPHSLGDNMIWAIYEGRAGLLWIGTDGGGLNRFDPQTERFTRYRHDPDDPHSLSHNVVQSIYEDRAGTLWVGTNGGGLNRFDPQTERFARYRHDPDDPYSLGSDTVWTIYEDRAGVLWIGTWGGGLNRFDPQTERFTRYQHNPDDPHSLSNNVVWAIYEDRAGRLWIGSNGGGLDRFDPETERFIHYQHDSEDPDSLSDNIVQPIYEDRTGALWIGTNSGGLNRFDPETGQFIRYQHDPADPHSLSNDNVWTIYEDRAGLLWIGTWGGGLNKYDRKTERFRLYQHDPGDSYSLSDNIVFSIYEDRAGLLWVGSSSGGLNKFDRETGQFVYYQHDSANPHSLSHNNVLVVYEDRVGTLWAGTWGGGLNRFDPGTEQFIRYQHDPDNPHSLSDNAVTSVYEDRAGRLWVGTYGGGLNKFDRETEQFVHYQHDPDAPYSLSHNTILSIYEDLAGQIWVGTWGGGLNRFDPGTEQFIRYQHDPSDPYSLSDDTVPSIYEDRAGTLWVGTYGGGLNKFDRGKETFTHYREKDGLPNDGIYGILEDEQGNLWLSTNKGLSKFNPGSENFKNYDVRDGLQGNEFNAGAYHKSKSGEMFFGGVNGFNTFYPEDIKDNPHIPPITLTDFQLFNKPVGIGGDSPLQKAIGETEALTLSYRDYVFSFGFAALDYTAPEKNQYAYMMEGFDKEWVYVDAARRFAPYANLPAGEYTFRVRGANNDGVWNENGAAIKITVTAPFWQTWWFMGLMAVLVVGAVIGAFQLRLRAVEAQRRRLSEVEEAERRRLARELHDQVGQNLSVLGINLNIIRARMPEEAAALVGSRLDDAAELVKQVTKSIRAVGDELRAPVLDDYGLVAALRWYGAGFAERTGLEVTLQGPQEDAPRLAAPVENALFRIAQEALTNVAKHAQARRVMVTVEVESGTWRMIVADDGVGFDPARPARPGERRGLGLISMSERARVVGGRCRVESRPQVGTRVIVEVPR
jgi:signal transduction histidine kinase/ligand-binding sensor domain-containing protein